MADATFLTFRSLTFKPYTCIAMTVSGLVHGMEQVPVLGVDIQFAVLAWKLFGKKRFIPEITRMKTNVFWVLLHCRAQSLNNI